jgi:hypothetical protein
MNRRNWIVALVVPWILFMGLGCPEETVEETQIPTVRLAPPAGGLGMTVEVELRGTNTQWDDEWPVLDMGGDIELGSPRVEGRTLCYFDATISETALLGRRDVTVVSGGHELVLDDAFVVQTGGISILPDRARLGESIDVEVTGYSTIFQDGYTQASFGDGIWIDSVEVLTETSAIARISIDPSAAPGDRDVTVFNGSTAWTLFDGFLVDRSAVTFTFDPPSAYQGDEVDFTIKGTDTAFIDGETGLMMGDDIIVDFLTVIGPTDAFGRMTLSNAATVGTRDVTAESSGELLIVHDGFEVLPVAPDVTNALVSYTVSVSRMVDNNNCAVGEGYSTYIMFYEPLDQPCGESPPPTMVFPFDINYNYPVWSGDDSDCPFPNTFDAGDHVYLDSTDGSHSLTYDRDVDPYSGITAYYLDHGMTLADYHFDRHYTMRADGSEDETQVPAFDTSVDETLGADPGGVILHTIPLDYEVLTPQLCNNFTHDPAEDLLVEWTLAMTYDVAGLSLTLQTQSAEDPDDAWYNIVLPWDDGEWTFTPDMLSMLPEGNGYLVFSDGASQPTWQLPFSDIGPSSPPGSSGISTMGFMILSGASGEEEPAE